MNLTRFCHQRQRLRVGLCLCLCLGLLESISHLSAQTTSPAIASAPAPASSPTASPSSWQQLEATYQNELKKIHIPLLSAYINELTRLAAQSRNAETTVAINRELKEMQAIITSGGVVDLTTPPLGSDAPTPPNQPSPPRPKDDRVLVLTPATAKEVSPTPASPLPPAIPIRKIAWTIDSLSKGKYEIICQGAVTALDTPASLTLQAGDQLLKFPLAKRHIASDTNGLRLIRVGTIDLQADVTLLPLTLEIDSASAAFIVRQVLVTRTAKPAAAPPAAP
jgi:hypothetical protein